MNKVPESMIQSMQQKGFTYLGVVAGKVIFCNLKSEESIKRCLSFLESITGEEWNTFRETTGSCNLVFYKKSMFKVFIGYNHKCLHFIVDSETVELPLNCSSCYCMFSNVKFPKGFTLGNNFDTSKVINMEHMFDCADLPKGFTLGDKFDTSSVTSMHGMFFWSELPGCFTLGDKFDTSNVTDMEGMFQGVTLPRGFTLGDSFDTTKVTNMDRIFCKVDFPEDFVLVDKFNHSSALQIKNMFTGARLPEEKCSDNFKSNEEILDWLKSRKPNVSKLSAF